MESKLKLDAFTLKVIAITVMTCNHIAHGFRGFLPIYLLAPFYVVGGLTFPIMAFLLIEGYHKTRNVKKVYASTFGFRFDCVGSVNICI